jgi:hypothetical protein
VQCADSAERGPYDLKDYEQSKLWQLALKERIDDPFSSARGRLQRAYEIFWDRSIELARRINTDFPPLTLHDERHLTALWDRASQLTNEKYPINALEAFAFGGAVLLHDSGHACAAYEGGLNELKQTREYRDVVAATLRKNGLDPPRKDEIDNPTEEIAKAALFAVVRRLHAKQAEVLATRVFGENKLYLIDDSELRDSLAQLIGKIAASHNWDGSLLEGLLPQSQNAPGIMPQDWVIRPVKIACLLRCADAIQIDQRRALAFPFALHTPTGLSRLHWLAQQLAQPNVIHDEGDGPGAIEFTSQNDFTEGNADAWWIAHDLIKTANKELQDCYQLMKDLNLPAFLVDRVAGAEGPLQLARHIRTAGWQPINAEVRATSVKQIINLFGGRLLYGNNPVVPLRELIQNASDAVRARRALPDSDPRFEGKVYVRLKKAPDADLWQLIVEDDGTGMSERVLSGALLEFGKSFWSSEEIQDEFPGLASADLRLSGRYGIGFFSCLMIADRIEVTSRRWDKGADQARKLVFRKGLELRPLISKELGTPLDHLSTRVVLYISSSDASRLLTISSAPDDKSKITLKELVGRLCPCLDCDVLTSESDGSFELAHTRKWEEVDTLQWCREVTYAGPRAEKVTDEALTAIAPLIQVIKGPSGETLGRAAISYRNIKAGVKSIGALASAQIGFTTTHVGAIEYEPRSPRREPGDLRGPGEVKVWASKQAELLAQEEITDSEKYTAAINVAEFRGDPTPIAIIPINRKLTSLAEVYGILAKGTAIFAPVEKTSRNRTSLSWARYWVSSGYGIGVGPDSLNFEVLTMEKWGVSDVGDPVYCHIPLDGENEVSTFLSCLQAFAGHRGRIVNIESANDIVFATYRGEPSTLERLFVGAEFRGDGIKISLT